MGGAKEDGVQEQQVEPVHIAPEVGLLGEAHHVTLAEGLVHQIGLPDTLFAAKLMEIYAGGKQPWNNAMIIKYLEACPLPEAKQFLQHLSH